MRSEVTRHPRTPSAAADAVRVRRCALSRRPRPPLGEFLKIAKLLRIEVHGPAAELEQLKEAFAAFNPDYYVSECGIGN